MRGERSGLANRVRGFTLLEIGIVMTIIAILLGAGVPIYSRMQQRAQMKAAAEALVQDLRNAHETVLLTRSPVFATFSGTPQDWCWGISRGAPCDCSGQLPLPACNISQGSSQTFKNVRLLSSTPMKFEAPTGQSPAGGTASFATPRDERIDVHLGVTGRVQACEVGSTNC